MVTPSGSNTDTTPKLHLLRDALARRGIHATGPHIGSPSPESDFLTLPDNRHVHVQRDRNGYWQAMVYEGRQLVRMADVDATGWPGDPVAISECEREFSYPQANPTSRS